VEPVELPRELSTERLTLRPFALSDAGDVFAYATSAGWDVFLPVPQPYTQDDAETFIARCKVADWGVNATWAIVFEGQAVGGMTVIPQPEQGRAMLGYSIGSELWGRGLVLEASVAILDAAFATQPWLNKVWANADSRNTASMRVMEKLGMQREGVLRSHRLHRGEPLDDVYYGLLRAEWEGR
jgi:[ribosomal protein S5]-alanine N-acetyltransferase